MTTGIDLCGRERDVTFGGDVDVDEAWGLWRFGSARERRRKEEGSRGYTKKRRGGEV